VYNQYLENQFNFTKEEIDDYQREKMHLLFKHHLEKNETYRKFLYDQGFNGDDYSDIKDIPVITRDYFKNNPDNHMIKELVHKTKYSGGSTGVPLTIHLSREALSNFWPSIWRAFDVYGVHPCDKIMMLAGPSLYNNRSFKRRIYDLVTNFVVISAFDLTPTILLNAYKSLVRNNIKAIYGYTSAILVFLNFLEEKNLHLDLKCIFTTSETFIPRVRYLAREFCNCDVIDTYGAKDGGVSAFECNYHTGYHLNFEQCLVEIVDHNIIITDLFNTASPFIRYKLGDFTSSDQIITDKCECGRVLYRIESIAGRIHDFFTDITGKKVHSEFFNRVFDGDELIKQYQIRYSPFEFTLNIICDPGVSEGHFQEKYHTVIGKRVKMPLKIVTNEQIISLPNGKVPIIVKQPYRLTI
jgi:phenylacetate-CoA ligase